MKIQKYDGKLKGTISIPGDKSISHRCVMLSSIAQGETKIHNFSLGQDCKATIDCFRNLGVDIKVEGDVVRVNGVGLYGLKKPYDVLNVRNSGTTIRLISGILAGQKFESTIIGDDSIQRRPMNSIIEPLKLMGANIEGIDNKYSPIRIKPVNKLSSIKYYKNIVSSQVKSCILFAGMYSCKPVKIMQPQISRDHTERLMQYFGIPLIVQGNEILMESSIEMTSKEIYVPGDISTASFYMTAALLFKGSEILLKNVGINETRTGIIEVYKKMGAKILIDNYKIKNNEPSADIRIRYSKLTGTTIDGDLIPKLIDEIPAIAVAAAFADGSTIFKNVKGLRCKEINRITAIVNELKKMGIDIELIKDGIIINGCRKIKPALLNSYNDHRIAMALNILAMKAQGNSELINSECVKISDPNFYKTIKKLSI